MLLLFYSLSYSLSRAISLQSNPQRMNIASKVAPKMPRPMLSQAHGFRLARDAK